MNKLLEVYRRAALRLSEVYRRAALRLSVEDDCKLYAQAAPGRW
ncbi:MAG: hypothetical protein OXI96_08205 [Acidimicrobiaceae bacterium]|nr:hypothetical protein [Acidimicrobiaceae bacterium]